jgi:outer membrane protein
MRHLWSAILVLGTALPVAAQTGAGATLTLDEALALAKKNNPLYLQTLNGRVRADAALRTAYGAFLPSANGSFSTGYRQGKQQFFGGVAFGATSDILSSSWGLDFSARVNAATVANLRRSRASLDAAQSDLAGAEANLRSNVTQEYVLVLQTAARAVLQDSLVVSNQLQLDLARAKAGVGSATSLDVKRAEVALGQQQVAALKAHNLADVTLLQLFQLVGVNKPDQVRLTSTFTVAEPTLDPKELLELARKGNPTLQSLMFRESAAAQSLRAAQGEYTPTLSFNANLGGFTQKYKDGSYLVNQAAAGTASSRASCFTTDSLRRGAGLSGITSQCNAIAFTDAQASALRNVNNDYPFKFTSNPYNLSLGLSLPLFDGFGREQRVQEATAGRSDARYNVRAQELKLTADVTSAYTTLVADFRTVRLQEANARAAQEALQLAQERYRVGLNSLVDLQQARGDYERAQTDLIDATYEYHRAYAALESAVGRTLR